MLKEILGRENIMLFVFGDHGMTSTGMFVCFFCFDIIIIIKIKKKYSVL